ncbi:MAG: CaiB/BaiF CoA transferase family protein [Acidimicrobiales bacterium]
MASDVGAPPLADVRVLDRTTEIAGPYCTKLLADAGADVVKVEPDGGDPLRRWRSGALFEFLNRAKRADPLEGWRPHILVVDERVDVAALHAADPALVVVTITPFGTDGPWADRPATEFTLQAWCGSTGNRGLPEAPPIAAGGRIGEWVTGTYAAVGALAALREARRSGHGDHVDVAMLDCMAITMAPYPTVYASFLGWPDVTGTMRTIEVPSIEPTKDGFAVFTTNSAQQFADFLVMIGRPDLLEDSGLVKVHTRFARRAEFLEHVHRYTEARTTAEVLEDAAEYRVPSGPVHNGATVTEFEQFVARGVFEDLDGFVQPRIPYRISGPPAPPATLQARPSPWQLPLTGLRVVDCTGWWAGPAVTHMLGCLGADVIKVEAAARPDGMRLTSTRYPPAEQWWEWGPIFHAVNTGKRSLTLDLTTPEGARVFEALLETADLFVENYTPRVMEQFGFDWDRVHALNSRLIMVRMPAFGLDGPWRDRTGFAQTMEALTGLAWVTGPADGPPVLVRGAGDPIAAMHGVVAVFVALSERDGDGIGRLVESTMVEAVLNVAAEQVVEYRATGEVLGRTGNDGPPGVVQGVFRAAGEDVWLALTAATEPQTSALGALLGGAALADWSAARDVDEAVTTLLDAGIPAAAVVPAREIGANAQLQHRHLFEDEHHPVTGVHPIPSLPFRFGRVERWTPRPSPTLGQHNDELLTELGFAADIQSLRSRSVIGDHL